MKDTLYILWTNSDVATSDKMVLTYSINSVTQHWWKNVQVMLWGATPKLAGEDKFIQERIKMALHAGVKISACKSCADSFGVSDILTSIGISVVPLSEEFTRILKDDEKLITI